MAALDVNALLGRRADALREDITLATPLTLPRIAGRVAVQKALAAYADAFGADDADLFLEGADVQGAVLTSTIDGHTVQLLALVSHDSEGLIAAIDIYGRPWPYMALVRERLGRLAPELIDPSLGDPSYVPEGPGAGWIDAPAVPPLAEDVAFYSPLLTAVATGKAVNERILTAAAEIYGEQKFRALLQVVDHPAIAAVFDGTVEDNVLQLVAIFTLNADSAVREIRIFSRPWPVTAYFRAGMYKLLTDILGPEYWQGPDPDGPLPIR
jgi:hypothetical protein